MGSGPAGPATVPAAAMPPARRLSQPPAPARGGRRSRAPRVTRRSWARGARAEALGTEGRSRHKPRPGEDMGPGSRVHNLGARRCWVSRRQWRGPPESKSWRCRAVLEAGPRSAPFSSRGNPSMELLGLPHPHNVSATKGTVGIRRQCPRPGTYSFPAPQPAPSHSRTAPFSGLAHARPAPSPTCSVNEGLCSHSQKDAAHSRLQKKHLVEILPSIPGFLDWGPWCRPGCAGVPSVRWGS